MLSGSVGQGGRNLRSDVLVVQRLLKEKKMDPGPIDGVCGRRTTTAIFAFQKQFLSHPDGRVDPGGVTWSKLVAPARGANPSGLTTNPLLTTSVDRSSLGSMNTGVSAVSNKLMKESFGNPRASYSQDCQPVTNENLKSFMKSGESAGPFRVSGFGPAIDSLSQVMAQIQIKQPEVYRALGTAGMLCCRLQRNSATAISNHSWGTAIDLKLNAVLDAPGDGKVQYGLTLIAPIFNQFGWYWGAAFDREDAMHFEAGADLIATWKSQVSPPRSAAPSV